MNCPPLGLLFKWFCLISWFRQLSWGSGGFLVCPSTLDIVVHIFKDVRDTVQNIYRNPWLRDCAHFFVDVPRIRVGLGGWVSPLCPPSLTPLDSATVGAILILEMGQTLKKISRTTRRSDCHSDPLWLVLPGQVFGPVISWPLHSLRHTLGQPDQVQEKVPPLQKGHDFVLRESRSAWAKGKQLPLVHY